MRKTIAGNCLALALFLGWGQAETAGATSRFALFGQSELYAPTELVPAQWRRVLRAIDGEHATYAACSASTVGCPSPAARRWQLLLTQLGGKPPLEQMAAVNSFANRVQYRTDLENFGRSDYWATPLEFLTRAGDCEDYAIFKYVSLRQLGFSADQLKLLVLEDVERRLTHAVLRATVDGKTYLLDNLEDEVRTEAQLPQYLPLYWVTEKGAHRLVARDTIATENTGDRSVPAAATR